jgi:hypothetical protein
MFDQLSAEILASLIKGFPTTTRTTTTTTKQNVDPAVHFVYSRVKSSDEQFLQAPRNWQKCSALGHSRKIGTIIYCTVYFLADFCPVRGKKKSSY